MRTIQKSGPLPDGHVPDLLAPGLKLVFCGTALGRVSAQRQAYYANPGNFFWRTLHEIGLTPERLPPERYPELLGHGIGLTDLCKAHFGNDADLPPDAFDIAALRAKLQRYRPGILAFTSKTGAAAFLGTTTGALSTGFQHNTIDGTRIAVLPSPSGQARIFWDIAPWQQLAKSLIHS